MKPATDLHLLRMRVHYLNCNEKTILRHLRDRYALRTGLAEADLSVTQRRLNISINNTWVNLGQERSVNLA